MTAGKVKIEIHKPEGESQRVGPEHFEGGGKELSVFSEIIVELKILGPDEQWREKQKQDGNFFHIPHKCKVKIGKRFAL